MKRLLPAAALALAMHALLLRVDLPQTRPRMQTPARQTISIQLMTLPPKPPAQTAPSPPPEPAAPVRPALPPRPPKKIFPREITPAPLPRPEPPPPQTEALDSSPSPPESAPAEPLPPPEDPGTAPTPEPGEAAAVRISVPRYDLNPPIVYPGPARRRNLEGTVLLDVYVTAEGRPAQVKVARSSGHVILDNSAVESVRRWRFDPARQDERAIAMWVQVPVRYALK